VDGLAPIRQKKTLCGNGGRAKNIRARSINRQKAAGRYVLGRESQLKERTRPRIKILNLKTMTGGRDQRRGADEESIINTKSKEKARQKLGTFQNGGGAGGWGPSKDDEASWGVPRIETEMKKPAKEMEADMREKSNAQAEKKKMLLIQ